MKYLNLAIAVVLGVVLGAEYHPLSVKAQAPKQMYVQSMPFSLEQLSKGYQAIGSDIAGFSCIQSKGGGEPTCFALTVK